LYQDKKYIKIVFSKNYVLLAFNKQRTSAISANVGVSPTLNLRVLLFVGENNNKE